MNTWSKSIAILVFILIACLAFIFALSQVTQEGRKEIGNYTVAPTVVEEKKPVQTTLVAVASKTQVDPGEIFTIAVNLDSGDNLVTGVQLAMRYDPLLVEVTNVIPGDYLINPIEYAKKVNSKTGDITYAIGSFQERKGTGVIAKIEARARKKTNGLSEILIIGNTSIVTDLKTQGSVLKDAKGASIVIR